MFSLTSMRVHHTLVVASITFLLGACSGETVSEGVDTLEVVKDWFEAQEDSESTGGSTNTITLVPAAAVNAASVDVNTEQSTPETDSPEVLTNAQAPLSTPYVESVITNSEDLIPLLESETSLLTTSPDFLFRTAKSIKLKVNIASAVGTQATLSLCTDFEATESGFDVNYDSCPIRGAVIDGQFESDVALVNQFNSAIAIIWFPYQESEPLYRTFNVAEDSSSLGVSEWLWND